MSGHQLVPGYGDRSAAVGSPYGERRPVPADGEYGELRLRDPEEVDTLVQPPQTTPGEIVPCVGYAEREQGTSYATRGQVDSAAPATQQAAPSYPQPYAGRSTVATSPPASSASLATPPAAAPSPAATAASVPAQVATSAGYGERQTSAYPTAATTRLAASAPAPAPRASPRSGARIQCPQCSYVAGDAASLRNHAAAVHTMSISPSTCTFCGKVYPSPRDLAIHMEKRHGGASASSAASTAAAGGGSIECQFCSRRFSDQASVWDHVASRHRI